MTTRPGPHAVAVTLLAQCGPDAKFAGNHHAILATQKTWLKRIGEALKNEIIDSL